MRVIIAIILNIVITTNMCSADNLLSKEKFRDIVIQKITRDIDTVDSVAIIDDISMILYLKDGKELKADFTNAYNEYKLDPKELDTLIDRYTLWLNNFGETSTDIKRNILPVIKGKDFINQVSDHLESSFVYKKLNEELYIFYVINNPQTISSLTKPEFKSLGITEDSLYQLALTNLINLNLNIEFYANKDYGMLIAGGDFEASLILLESTWKEYCPFKENIVICVLARDLVVVTQKDNSVGYKFINEYISKKDEISYYISDKLFTFNNGTWEIFDK